MKECSKCHEPLLFEVDDDKFVCDQCQELEFELIKKNGMVINVLAETTVELDLSYQGNVYIAKDEIKDVLTNGKVDKSKVTKWLKDYFRDMQVEDYTNQDYSGFDPTIDININTITACKETKDE